MFNFSNFSKVFHEHGYYSFDSVPKKLWYGTLLDIFIYLLQLLSEFLNFSAASFSALIRYPVSENKISMTIVEKFILEQLNLTKDAVSESKVIFVHILFKWLSSWNPFLF